MKIQCDVCNKDEASVFCSADEAALCNGCDHRVHHANILASKHHRFSLLRPSSSSSEATRCDICQERRAFLFCREDRAILCRECDVSIHTANELTKKHNRFLLTGVKLSSTSAIFTSGSTTTITSSSTSNIERDIAASEEDSNNIKNIITASKNKTSASSNGYQQDVLPFIQTTSNNSYATVLPSKYCDHSGPTNGGSTSSISEYLMETLPGWQVEDFLVDSSPTPTHGNGFCKNEGDLHPYLDANYFDNQSNSQGYVVSEDLSLWVPEAPVIPINYGLNLKGFVKENPIMSSKQVNRRRSDHGFTVPSISPPSNNRSRHNW